MVSNGTMTIVMIMDILTIKEDILRIFVDNSIHAMTTELTTINGTLKTMALISIVIKIMELRFIKEEEGGHQPHMKENTCKEVI